MDVLRDLVPDHGEVSQGGVHDAVPKATVSPKDQPEDTDEREQQREHREESVVGDERGQVAGLVVTELLEHREGEGQPVLSLLEVIEAIEGPYDSGTALEAEGITLDAQNKLNDALVQVTDTTRKQLEAIKLSALLPPPPEPEA